MKNILVAMSGGVDSAVAALLLSKQGHRVTGAYIRTWISEEEVFSDCPWQREIKDARAVAESIGIDFLVLNFIREYHEKVVHYMVEGYRNGTTPNPDAICNREMKFGVFLDYALSHGYDGVATGHYCRIAHDAGGGLELLEGFDKNKDQSYFLALVRREQLKRVLFPTGDLTKPEVRELARQARLPNAEKKDSQGICFLGKVRIADFLSGYIEDQPGEIVTARGRVLGPSWRPAQIHPRSASRHWNPLQHRPSSLRRRGQRFRHKPARSGIRQTRLPQPLHNHLDAAKPQLYSRPAKNRLHPAGPAPLPRPRHPDYF